MEITRQKDASQIVKGDFALLDNDAWPNDLKKFEHYLLDELSLKDKGYVFGGFEELMDSEKNAVATRLSGDTEQGFVLGQIKTPADLHSFLDEWAKYAGGAGSYALVGAINEAPEKLMTDLLGYLVDRRALRFDFLLEDISDGDLNRFRLQRSS